MQLLSVAALPAGQQSLGMSQEWHGRQVEGLDRRLIPDTTPASHDIPKREIQVLIICCCSMHVCTKSCLAKHSLRFCTCLNVIKAFVATLHVIDNRDHRADSKPVLQTKKLAGK